MAASDTTTRPSVLQALTAAALLLPGLQTVAQPTDSLSVQSSLFSEGDRPTSVATGLPPLQAWSLTARGSRAVSDSLQLDIALMQDTWSGATPVTVAPTAFGGNRVRMITKEDQTVAAGASPLINGGLLLDATLQPLLRDDWGLLHTNTGSELVMSSASPEVRRQLDLTLRQTKATRRLETSLILSEEPDYHSQHAGLRGEWDLNQQHTTLALIAGFTHNRIAAHLGSTWIPYLTTTAWQANLQRNGDGVRLLASNTGRNVGMAITQVLSSSALLDIGISLSHSRGFLENPYRSVAVAFVDPAALDATTNDGIHADIRALVEQRPDLRRQRAASMRYVQHITPLDAALHMDYDYSSDDWHIESHALQLQWLQPMGEWLLAPRLRWYSQRAAWFHQDWFVSPQRYRSTARDDLGREIWRDANDPARSVMRTQDGRYLDSKGNELDAALLDLRPDFRSFSPTLLPSQFASDPRLGAYGVLSTGITLQRRLANGLLFEAGFDHYRRASTLQINGSGNTPYADYDYRTASLSLTLDLATTARRQRLGRVHQHTSMLPAGLVMTHDSGTAGSMSTGYRLQRQTGMTMHMLDLAWHPNQRLNLLLMPQFMTMHTRAGSYHMHGASGATDDISDSHAVDTVVAAQWQVPAGSGEWQLTAGIAVPSTRRGNADWLPSLQYRNNIGRWHSGIQISGSVRSNSTDMTDADATRALASSVWLATMLTPDFAASLRATNTSSHYATGTSRRETAIALGINIVAPGIAVEWQVPVGKTGTIYQERTGHTLVARWHRSL